VFYFFPLKSCRSWDNVEKNFAERGKPKLTLRRILIACWTPNATNNTLSLCNNHCLSTATMVTRTRLNILLYINCLSGSNWHQNYRRMELLTASMSTCLTAQSDKTGNMVRSEVRKANINIVVMCFDAAQIKRWHQAAWLTVSIHKSPPLLCVMNTHSHVMNLHPL